MRFRIRRFLSTVPAAQRVAFRSPCRLSVLGEHLRAHRDFRSLQVARQAHCRASGFCSDRSEITPDFSTHDKFSPSLRTRAPHLLWPLLTSGNPSRHLAVPIAQSRLPDLPGYDAPTFTLMPVGFTPQCSVQVSGFASLGLLTPLRRLGSASCTSGQRFAHSFLQIPSHPGHPCRSANTSPCRVCRGLPPPSECALPGAIG